MLRRPAGRNVKFDRHATAGIDVSATYYRLCFSDHPENPTRFHGVVAPRLWSVYPRFRVGTTARPAREFAACGARVVGKNTYVRRVVVVFRGGGQK